MVDDVIRAVAEYLGRSGPWHQRFMELQEVFTSTNLEVQGIHDVRWLSRGAAVIRFVQVLPAIMVMLSEWKDQTMYELVTSYRFQFLIRFLADMLEQLNVISSVFQKREIVTPAPDLVADSHAVITRCDEITCASLTSFESHGCSKLLRLPSRGPRPGLHAPPSLHATTKPLALRATSPSPLRDLQQITERHVALARQFALGFAQEVAEAALDHLADVYYALMLVGERLRLPLLGSPSSSPSAEPLHLLMKQSNAPFAAVIPGDTVAELVVTQGIYSFLNLYNTVLIVRILLTWFPNAPSAIVSPLSTICDPYLNIFRGLIPPIGGTLDLSPILAFVVLSAFTNASVALPAEMPEGEAPGGEVSGGRGGMLGGRRRRPVRLTREQREKMRAASRAAEQGQEA
ncbi:unnamed protein product [Closterium sp. Naga37s-1]|nr:unnamed protein product [Closterium sp. Naga37s-1]